MSITTVAIDAEEVARRFDTTWVLRGINLRVDAGETVGLLGANGTGKSTLLRIVATLLRAHAGRVTVFGHDTVRAPDEVRSIVGYMAHAPGLYGDLTARENLLFAASMLDRDAREVDDALARVGLSLAANETVRAFSSGMQRRLAIGRLLLARPRLLLLDEPYSNLDADGIALMNTVIAERVEAGASALVVIHELGPAAAVLDRTETLIDGRIVAPPPLTNENSVISLVANDR
jgi:heme ABC exporter ATP-binding subunit CcmA